ncbi:toxin VasX [Achromobacter sp. NPDC058515]|uniref:toxin VasX n=1 Tax=Achromobacter sp. NPDC058515 TaxID=3346533 RepID=UPI0036486DAB
MNYKKALSPDHPSEKRAGKAISPPPCERGVPVYPLRYGVSAYAADAKLYPTLGTAGYPALRSGKAYGPRVLRPGSYVYLFYFRHGRMWTQHYQVTQRVRFARIWWRKEDDDDLAPGRLSRPDEAGSKSYLLAPQTEIADTVHLLVSDTVLTHRTLWRIETNQNGLRDKLATTLKPAGGAGQANVLAATTLANACPELAPPATRYAARPYPWSEIQFTENEPADTHIAGAMYIALLPFKSVTPLAVVLQDPIGVASELHYLATDAVKRKTRYAADNAHKLLSGQLIANYFQTAEKGAQRSPDLAKAVAKQRRLVDHAGAVSFAHVYAREIGKFDAAIAAAVQDVKAWVLLIEAPRLLGKALSCFDLASLHNARAYEQAVFNCIGGLVHTQEGQQALSDLVAMPPSQSPYWLALANGSKILIARLQEKVGDIAKNLFDVLDKYLEEHAATPATNALIGLLQALPQSKQADILVRRLRHVLEIRFNATIVRYDVSLPELLRAAYEFQGHQALGEERLRGWKLPAPRVGQTAATARVLVYDWVKIGETTYRELDGAPAERPALPPARPVHAEGNLFSSMMGRMRAPAGHFFTGLGGFLALKGLADAWKNFNTQNGKNPQNFFSNVGAVSALVGAGIEIGAAAIVMSAGTRGNAALATWAHVLRAKYGVALFGAGGVGIAAAADAVRAGYAVQDSNLEQAGMYLGSAIAGGVIALSTWGGGTAAVSTIANGGTVALVLGLSAGGWAIVGLVALGLGIAFVIGTDMTRHGPVEIWLKHSIWGVNSRHYTKREELDAVHGLYYRPRFSAEWINARGRDVGTLRIHCQLPGVDDSPGDRFQTKLTFSRHGKVLARTDGPVLHASGTSPVDYDRECLVTSLGYTGNECGWAISMHEDTEVGLEYLFFPDFEQSLGLAVAQPGAPAQLVFSSGGLLSDPIDITKLEPVRPPQ